MHGVDAEKKVNLRSFQLVVDLSIIECFEIPIHTYRTHNRNRSLSFINSDQQVNVDKGSRLNEPVTLGKRLALMIEHQVKSVCKVHCDISIT